MAGNTLAWHKAIKVLGWVPDSDEAMAGWPESLVVEDIAKLQYPERGQVTEQTVLTSALLSDIQAGAIPAEYIEAKLTRRYGGGLCTILDSCYYCRPSDALQWLKLQGETLSGHILAWADALEGKSATVPASTVGGDEGKSVPWASLAREIGADWLASERKEGRTPGVNAVAQHVQGEFAERNIKGVRGEFLDWQTIKKPHLNGITGRAKNGEKRTK